jgi:penicillin amidase
LLDVDGETVQVHRDDFGRPSIFAESNRGLFTAAGYVAAEDRLWQIDLNRRVSRGRLAEAFGPGSVLSDTFIRTTGYTDAELDAMLAELPASEQEVYTSYAAGINRYLGDARANPFGKLPFEFHAVGLGVPADYTAQDVVAFVVFMMRRVAEIGGHELQNKQLLDTLVARYGAAQGYAIFDDLRWINDPEAPASVPEEGAFGKRQHRSRPPNTKQLEPSGGLGADTEALRKHWEELGIPTRLGSFGWAVSPKKSAHGYAMLYGGPQLGFAAPEIVHEVQLKSDEGVNVSGITIPGVPWVVIGRNDHIAWTLTAGLAGDNMDIYLEELCDAGAGFGSGYVFDSACRPYSARVEVITVRGAPSQTIMVLRSVHGPVVALAGGYAATQKRAHWMTELQAANAVAKIDRARNLQEFETAVHEFTGALNFLYADKRGNIAYWLSGLNPLRAPGFDPRLPLPGDGSAEWTGGYRPIPASINPTRGWLASWNNKPTADYEDGDGGSIFGSQPFSAMHRYDDLAANFERPSISLDDMREIPKDIARVNALNRNGREARFLVPYLLTALDAVPPLHPVAPQARAVLEDWDGSMFADAVTSETMLSGQVIFATWLSRVLANTFADELGPVANEASSGVLLHALDHALRAGGSPVPPSRDYFNGVDPRVVLSRSFDEAVFGLTAAMGPVASSWAAPRGFIEVKHTLLGTLAKFPLGNRSTYAQLVQLKNPTIEAENILPLGQSGMIRLTPTGGFAFDDNFFSQFELFTAFAYKPMPLYRNTELRE